MSEILNGVRDYLSSGGLFNPELMDHQRTRDLIIECRDEIERLRQQVTQRGARMQVMHDYLTQYSSQSTTLWRDFCRVCPEAAAWFDDEGVPR